MPDRYVAGSAPLIHTPGMFRWGMGCTSQTWNKEARTVAARMYGLARLLPGMDANMLMDVAEDNGRVLVEVDEDAGTVTFTRVEPEIGPTVSVLGQPQFIEAEE